MRISQKCAISFLFSSQKNVNLAKNYYSILEVSSTSDKKTIKKSYIQLVKRFHPDVNPKGQTKFTDIQEAFEVLSHEESKIYYDNNSVHRGSGSSKANTSTSSSGKSSSKNSYQSYRKPKNYDYTNSSDYYKQSRDYYNEKQKQEKQNEKQSPEYENAYENQSFNKQSRQYTTAKPNQNNQSNYERYRQSKQNIKNNFEDFYQRQSQKSFWDQEQQRRQRQKITPEQLKLRDKLRAMKGLTSYYSMFWNKNQVRYKDVMNGGSQPVQQASSQQDNNLNQVVPQKIRKFYEKIMKKIDKVNSSQRKK